MDGDDYTIIFIIFKYAKLEEYGSPCFPKWSQTRFEKPAVLLPF